MASTGDSKQLRITSVYDSRGADKVKKEAQDLIAVYGQLSAAMKNVQTSFLLINNSATQSSTALSRQTVVIKDATRAANDYAETFKKLNAAQSSLTGGSLMAGSMRADFGADLRQLYSGGPPPRGPGGPFGGGIMGWGKAIGMVGTAAAGAAGAYGSYLQHEGRSAMHERLAPIHNLGEAQAYRNYMYAEAHNSPIGYQAVKAATNFRIKDRNSAPITFDPNTGAIIQPGDPGPGLSGTQLQGAGSDMSGYETEHRGNIWGMRAGLIRGGLKLAGGIGAMALAAGGTIATGGLGGLAAGGLFAGGAAGVLSGGQDIVQTLWSIHHEDKKLKEGGPEAKQNADKVAIERGKDMVLEITRAQLAAFNSLAPMSVAANRHGLGIAGYAFGQTDFEKGEAVSMAAGARRGYGRTFGRSAGGHANLNALFDAARMGMSSDAATSIIGSLGIGGGAKLRTLMAQGKAMGMGTEDMGLFERLASAGAGNIHSSGGGFRDFRAAGMMFGGMYHPSQYDVQARISGVGAGDRMFTGNNYFRARGMVDAARILGNGATGAQVTALSGASYADLLGGGSDKLAAMLGGGDKNNPVYRAMLESARKSRVNNLGNVLGGKDTAVGKMLGGQDLDTFLQGLNKSLGSKDDSVRKAAKNKLNVLAGYGSELTGEEFTDFQGMLGAYGNLNAALQGSSGFGKLGGMGVNVVSTRNRMQNSEAAAGEAWFSSDKVAEVNLGNNDSKFREFLSKRDPNLAKNFASASGGVRRGLAAQINSAYQEFVRQSAAEAGNGAGSAQALDAALGNVASRLNRGGDVSNALDQFRQDLKSAVSEFAMTLKRMQHP